MTTVKNSVLFSEYSALTNHQKVVVGCLILVALLTIISCAFVSHGTFGQGAEKWFSDHIVSWITSNPIATVGIVGGGIVALIAIRAGFIASNYFSLSAMQKPGLSIDQKKELIRQKAGHLLPGQFWFEKLEGEKEFMIMGVLDVLGILGDEIYEKVFDNKVEKKAFLHELADQPPENETIQNIEQPMDKKVFKQLKPHIKNNALPNNEVFYLRESLKYNESEYFKLYIGTENGNRAHRFGTEEDMKNYIKGKCLLTNIMEMVNGKH